MMLLLQQSFDCFLKMLLVACTLIRQSYQQTKDLTFCIENHTMSSTLQTFWHDANSLCELETKSLIELYSKLLQASSSSAQADQCSALLKHQVRKKLIQLIATQLEDSLIVKSLKTNRELEENLKRLQELDVKVVQIIWDKVINEVYLFVQPEEIINEIMQTKEPEIKITAFQNLLNKNFNWNREISGRVLPLLTCRIYDLFQEETSSLVFLKNLEHLYYRLPKDLRLLCESSQQTIGLLNYQHYEYLYAPRLNGPDAERRVPLTWSEIKNSTDSDGHLLATFDDKGLLSIGNRFGSALKYLYADKEQQAAYFWIGSGLKSSRWWQILWPHHLYQAQAPGYIMLQNEETKDLLCATVPYDENRRYVTLLKAKESLANSACFWLVTKF